MKPSTSAEGFFICNQLFLLFNQQNQSMLKLNQWIWISVLITFLSCSDKVENKFVIKGTITNVNSEFVFLQESSPNSQSLIVDSSRIAQDGSFQLTTITKEENMYLLRVPGNPQPIASVINDEEEITVNVDPSNKEKPYTVKGSKASTQLQDYFYTTNKKLVAIYNAGKTLDSMKNAGIPDSVLLVESRKKELAAIDIKSDLLQLLNNSESPSLSVFVIGNFQNYASNPLFGLSPFTNQELIKMVEKLVERFPDHQGVRSIQKMVVGQGSESKPVESALMNKPAPAFSLPDVNGKEVSLSSFKGKYVLIDFWASWCRPCREENPNLVSAFNEFKDKNFTILGVSLDKDKDPWIRAISDDQLTWQQVSDLRYWDSMVVPLYGIRVIPYNVLLDPYGVVVAENLRGEELPAKLQEILVEAGSKK